MSTYGCVAASAAYGVVAILRRVSIEPSENAQAAKRYQVDDAFQHTEAAKRLTLCGLTSCACCCPANRGATMGAMHMCNIQMNKPGCIQVVRAELEATLGRRPGRLCGSGSMGASKRSLEAAGGSLNRAMHGLRKQANGLGQLYEHGTSQVYTTACSPLAATEASRW